MGETETEVITSDEELISNARSGDQSAFAELWRRHYRSGVRVARQFTSSIDADDLVSEAYARIYQRVLAGGGPNGAFRPYLYTTIRNLASTWGSKSHDIQVDEIADFEDPDTTDDPVAVALDRTLTARAFRSLPDRWQSVLWYTEVEGMDPHEVAPLLGMSANGVAALSYRAREGLRKAWLQAHVSDKGVSEECRWSIARVGENARHSLTERERIRLSDHLQTCTKCAIISEEVDEVGSRLALVLLPIMLGAGVGGILLASLTHSSAAGLATASAVTALPAVPASFAAVAAPAMFAPTVGTALSLGAATGVSALIGSVAVVAAIGGSVALGLGGSSAAPVATTNASASSQLREVVQANANDFLVNGAKSGLSSALPGLRGGPVNNLNGTVNGATDAVNSVVGAVGGTVGTVVRGVTNTVVDPLLGSLTPGASPSGQAAPGGAPVTAVVDLSGAGTPGATVTVAAQAGGAIYATTKVGANGTWSVQIDALPAKVGAIKVTQSLLSLLGIPILTTPLSLNTVPLGIAVNLLN
jgi:RNA polymerase sigma factor (sigma-70 family)